MKFKIRFLLTCFLIFLSLPANGAEKKNILFLNSYQNGYGWSDSIIDGIRSVISTADYSIDLQIEYMDSKKHYDGHIESILFNYYNYKYKNSKFDAIIVSDNTAFRFMLRHRETLFPETPLIFCGVNDFSDIDIATRKNTTGVAEYPEFHENLTIALRLQPETRRMIVVGDESVTCRAILSQIKSSIINDKLDFDIIFMTRFNSSELIKQLKKVPSDTVIFFIPFFEKQINDVLSAREIIMMIYENTGLPIYSSWDFLLGTGLVGGRLASGHQHGKIAAKLALRVLSGEETSGIPVVTKVDAPLIFDYKVLKRFGIDKSQLPDGSDLINEPYHFYTMDRRVFWSLALIFFLLSGILFVLILNILKRKEVEKRLGKTEEKYRNIFKNAGKGIVIADDTGFIIEMNPAFAKIFGYPSEEKFMAENKRLQNIFVSQQRRKELLSQVFEGKEVSGFELEYYHPAGDIRWASITAKSVFYSGWKKQMIECICEDITQRKKAEIAVRESREKLRLILNNIPQLVFWQDDDLRFVEVNKSFLSFFNLKSPRDIIGKNDYNLLGIGDTAQRALMMNRMVITTNKPQYRIKWDFKKPGNETIWLEINKIPLHDENGGAIGILSTAEDITRKMNLEKQLLQSRKMEALGILSGGIAHDFNNILTSIINSTELAIEDIPHDSITRKDLERVLLAGNRGSNLVKQILTFSTPTHYEFRHFDVHGIVCEALELIETSLPGNITIIKNISPEPLFCLGDPTQIHQIIMNLCANSFQAMEETGGEFEISLGETIVDQTNADLLNIRKGDYIELLIADNGSGIEPDVIDKVFDPFFTTKSKDRGTGLGLSVVHGIIKGHDGGIRVTSTPFKKTEFGIYIPQIKEMKRIETDSPVSSFTGDETILFVEDNEDQRESVPRGLASLGYTVTAVSSAREAISELQKNPNFYDLVITDYDMPLTNGTELARELKKLSPRIPVMIISGRETDISAVDSVNIKKFLLKPYNKRILSEAIRQVMDNENDIVKVL